MGGTQVARGPTTPMKLLDYSIHAARAFLAFLGLVVGSAALGQWLDPARGLAIGFTVGLALFASLLTWLKVARHRGDGWIRAGRALGLRSIYSGHVPPIPVPGHQEPLAVLSGSFGPVTLIVGDRNERFLQYHTEAPLGTWETYSPEVSDPIPLETFVAVWIPGLDETPFRLGKRRSLFEGRETKPGGPFAEALESWSRQNPGWRIEGQADCLVLCRPNRLARVGQLPAWIDTARSLVAALGV